MAAKASGFSSLTSFSQGPPLEPSYLLSQLLVVRIHLLNHPSLSCLCCLCLLYTFNPPMLIIWPHFSLSLKLSPLPFHWSMSEQVPLN